MAEALYIHPAEARRRFEEFAATDFTLSDLAHGALLIALEEYPQLDIDYYLGVLGEIADAVRIRCRPGEPDIFKLGHLQAELFDARRFIGNISSYYEPRNSFLNEVIDRQVGVPISLSIIVIDVARRIGLDALGVGLPGHYLVKFRFELSELYVDPFHGGRSMSVPEIAAFVDEMSRGSVKLKGEHLRAWSARETLARVLANLQGIYARSGDQRRAGSTRERIDILTRRS